MNNVEINKQFRRPSLRQQASDKADERVGE